MGDRLGAGQESRAAKPVIPHALHVLVQKCFEHKESPRVKNLLSWLQTSRLQNNWLLASYVEIMSQYFGVKPLGYSLIANCLFEMSSPCSGHAPSAESGASLDLALCRLVNMLCKTASSLSQEKKYKECLGFVEFSLNYFLKLIEQLQLKRGSLELFIQYARLRCSQGYALRSTGVLGSALRVHYHVHVLFEKQIARAGRGKTDRKTLFILRLRAQNYMDLSECLVNLIDSFPGYKAREPWLELQIAKILKNVRHKPIFALMAYGGKEQECSVDEDKSLLQSLAAYSYCQSLFGYEQLAMLEAVGATSSLFNLEEEDGLASGTVAPETCYSIRYIWNRLAQILLANERWPLLKYIIERYDSGSKIENLLGVDERFRQLLAFYSSKCAAAHPPWRQNSQSSRKRKRHLAIETAWCG